MRKLFVKIFLWFWLTTTLIGVILVILALTTKPGDAAKARYAGRLIPYGRQLIRAYEDDSPEGLRRKIKQIEKKERVRLIFYNAQSGPISTRPLRPLRRRIVERAARAALERRPADERPEWPWRKRRRLVLPLGQDYVLFAEVPPPSRLESLLNPRALTLRLLVTFLVAGIVCYLLARSLSMPITRLRKATQAIADGNLSIRVAPVTKGQISEIADLATDFDQMAARLESLLHSRQRLLRDISHELRSPLARLNVALELARQRTGPEALAPLDRIAKEADRLNDLIGQLLTLAQLENQTEMSGVERLDMSLFLEKIVQDANYEVQNRQRGVHLAADREMVVQGSRELLHRAIENVIRNALWYTAADSTVEVGLDKYVGQGAFAQITVRDYGPGVPAAVLAELFRPFYRVGEARDRQSGGAGVGLAIAERAIRLHGGRIKAANADGGGLIVTILLPLGQAV